MDNEHQDVAAADGTASPNVNIGDEGTPEMDKLWAELGKLHEYRNNHIQDVNAIDGHIRQIRGKLNELLKGR